MIFFCNVACFFIIICDRFVFISEIHLNDFFHMFIQFVYTSFYVFSLGPNSFINDAVFIIG